MNIRKRMSFLDLLEGKPHYLLLRMGCVVKKDVILLAIIASRMSPRTDRRDIGL